MPYPRHLLGEQGEQVVASWLIGSGWQVLARRWRGESGGELDLVCAEPGGALVAVEVKLRRTARAGTGLEAVDRHRIARLRRGLAGYAASSGSSWRALRVDLVTLEPEGQRWRLRRHPGVDAW
ncbi:MAG TPA: YraN family protein [Candidatus Limnocylindria bacterium]|jgi:putative endonuclease|nr:YraN family protein [Candidatus Limnocylindria bacterium]